MATFKSLANRVRAFDRDEQGAAGSIEVIGAVAVGVLILAAALKLMLGDNGQGGLFATVKANLEKIVNGASAAAGGGS